MLRISRLISLGIAALLLLVAGALWLLEEYAGLGLVVDEAELMTPNQRAFVAQYHNYLRKDFDIDYRVVTASGVGDINRYAVKQFEDFAEDSRSETGRALLLVVDPQQDLVRLEVAFALEGVFPDAFIAYVEQRQMVPFFRQNRVADGILATTELIITRAQHASANAGFEDEAWATGSGGAGAVAPAQLGAGPEKPAPQQAAGPVAGGSPGKTLSAYFEAMQARNRSPNLAIYTPETRGMLMGWVMTPAQMDNVVKTYRGCHPQAPRIGANGRLAVIRYPQAERACAPFFFRQEEGAWALDLTMMQQAVRFGRSNAWRFDMNVDHPYRFAFEDWRFDKHGFPRIPK